MNNQVQKIDELKIRLSQHTSKIELTDAEFDDVRSIVADLARLGGNASKCLYDEGMRLLIREDARQQKETEFRFTELMSKARSGQEMTDGEKRELECIGSWLSQDH